MDTLAEQVAALEQIDRISLDYRVNVRPDVALAWAKDRSIIYTDMLCEILENIASAFGDNYYKIFIGREGSRVLYLQWYPDLTKVPAQYFAGFARYVDEYNVEVSGCLAELRVWWD